MYIHISIYIYTYIKAVKKVLFSTSILLCTYIDTVYRKINKSSLREVHTAHLPASFVPLDMEELSDSVVSGRFKLLPVLLRVRTAADPEELKKNNQFLQFTMRRFRNYHNIP